ncbi:MAG: caspase family protein [Rhizobiales bacterium]|nr:caspase family protein [Hyphomicrobiales bacterium]
MAFSSSVTRYLAAFYLAVAVWAGAAVPQASAKRVALVIGNDTYESVPVLQKARNDATSMGEALTKLGFDVLSAQDVGRRAMSRALVEFERKIEPGDVALLFFAGHGFAINGTNYLLPVDVPKAGPGEEGIVADASFAANGLADRLRNKGAATAVMILDACRDNPFAVKGKRSLAGTRGLARMSPAEGMFVLYSAGSGQAALDRLGENDAHKNSVFTRTLLAELNKPDLSMVQVAKRTQVQVRKLARKVGHEQTPAYYDQIIGDLFLAPKGGISAGAVTSLQEGGGKSVLPKQEQKLAALPPSTPEPLVNFMRSNAGWMVNVSLPEAATQFGYRVGENGSFVDPGFHDHLDQRTGKRMPKTNFVLPGDHPPATIYVTWRDKRGEQADVFPIAFNPNAALAEGQRKILEQLWTAWIAFREYNGLQVYFTHLISYRCGIKQVRYSVGDTAPDKIWELPPCDPGNPHAVPQNAKIHMKIPSSTAAMNVQLVYHNGSESQVRKFNVTK